jgi:hypothetical protein
MYNINLTGIVTSNSPPYNNENILIKIYNKKEITDKFNVMKLLLYMFFKEFHKLMPIYQYLINLS